MSRILFLSFLILMFAILQSDYAHAQWGPDHMAMYCTPCHSRFSKDAPFIVKNPQVLSITPCFKQRCHESNPQEFPPPSFPGDRWQLHMSICANCHPEKEGKFHIHAIHLNFSILQPPWEVKNPLNETLRNVSVDCKLCHFRPEGYNSSLVSVPPFNKSIYGPLFRPPWNNSCAYCHPSVAGAQRLHDVHEPVLVKACSVCHTSGIFEQGFLVGRVPAATNALQVLYKVEIKQEPLLLRELRAYLNGIIEQLLSVFESIRGRSTGE